MKILLIVKLRRIDFASQWNETSRETKSANFLINSREA